MRLLYIYNIITVIGVVLLTHFKSCMSFQLNTSLDINISYICFKHLCYYTYICSTIKLRRTPTVSKTYTCNNVHSYSL